MLKIASFLIIILMIFLNEFVNCNDHIVKPKCSKNEKVCEFHFNIGYKETMVYYDMEEMKGNPVVIMNKQLYRRTNCDQFLPLTEEELNNVTTADGSRRLIYTINGQFPGPPIIVYEDQEVVVHVKNNLLSDAVTVHWHGLIQRGTPWMDGVGSISQCPINPEETFTYRFVACPAGTNWYHSHIGVQRTDGLAGAFIVLEKERRGDDGRLPVISQDFVMVLQDWMRRSSENMYHGHFWNMARYMPGYGYSNRTCYRSTLQSDWAKVGIVPFTSGLINGKGHHYPNHGDIAANPELPLETYTVKYGKSYRFRVVNAAMIYAFRVSVDKHLLHLIAVDGNDIFVESAESIIVQPGERVDFIVHANTGISNYWIRAETLETRTTHRGIINPGKVLGIFHYEGCSLGQRPRTRRKHCTSRAKCRIINCPFGYFPKNSYIDCVSIAETKSTNYEIEQHPVSKPDSENEIQEIFLNFHFASNEKIPFIPSVSGIRFKRPTAPLQTYPQGKEFYETCKGKNCADNCCCTNIVKLEKNKTVQIILHNQDKTKFDMPHPIHMHGHHFHVLKMYFPEYKANGKVEPVSPDIECESEHCNYAKWSNENWYGDNIPGLNLKNPPLKDTVIVPRFGYTVLRLKADNPGYWFMHCHIEIHQAEGMALVLQEGEISDMAPTPPGFHKCGDFDWTAKEFERQMAEEKANSQLDEETSTPTASTPVLSTPSGSADISDDILVPTSGGNDNNSDDPIKEGTTAGLTTLEAILIGVICVLVAMFLISLLVVKRSSSPPLNSDPQREPLLKKETDRISQKDPSVTNGESESSH